MIETVEQAYKRGQSEMRARINGVLIEAGNAIVAIEVEEYVEPKPDSIEQTLSTVFSRPECKFVFCPRVHRCAEDCDYVRRG